MSIAGLIKYKINSTIATTNTKILLLNESVRRFCCFFLFLYIFSNAEFYELAYLITFSRKSMFATLFCLAEY
jgi:hypothetical protein